MLRSVPPAIAFAALLAASATAFAQPPGVGPFGPGFGPGAGRLDQVKQQLGASEEEWKVISPKLQKVIAARQALAADLRGPDAGPGFGPGAPGFPGFPGPGFPGPGFNP